jgi:hypothetical protein
MDADLRKTDEQSKRFFDKQMEDAKKSSAADREFFAAAQYARHAAEQNGLLPARNQEGDYEYTPQQGLKAACHAREDAAATLVIQRALLHRLDRNRNLLWVAIALLVYVAYRLS